jgi:hypothetical protein
MCTTEILCSTWAGSCPGLPNFSCLRHTKTGKIYLIITKSTKLSWNIPNDHKIHRHFPFQGPPKYICQNLDFGMQINYLATLILSRIYCDITWMVNHKKDSLDDQRSLFNAGTKAKKDPKDMNRSIVVLMDKFTFLLCGQWKFAICG